MSSIVGIVGFAFGLRQEELEPNPSNIALAEQVNKAYRTLIERGNQPIVIIQWEITKALAQLHPNIPVARSVELKSDGSYLDSGDVWSVAQEEFTRHGIDDVVVVAQPFLHLPSLQLSAIRSGYEVTRLRLGPVPFDDSSENTQPWTRSKRALLRYSVRSLLPGFKHGHDGQQSAH